MPVPVLERRWLDDEWERGSERGGIPVPAEFTVFEDVADEVEVLVFFVSF